MKVSNDQVKTGKSKISFEDYFLKQNHQDISLPYINNANSANVQPVAVLSNPRDIDNCKLEDII